MKRNTVLRGDAILQAWRRESRILQLEYEWPRLLKMSESECLDMVLAAIELYKSYESNWSVFRLRLHADIACDWRECDDLSRYDDALWKWDAPHSRLSLFEFWKRSDIPGITWRIGPDQDSVVATTALCIADAIRAELAPRPWYRVEEILGLGYNREIVDAGLEPALERLRHGLRLCCPSKQGA